MNILLTNVRRVTTALAPKLRAAATGLESGFETSTSTQSGSCEFK